MKLKKYFKKYWVWEWYNEWEQFDSSKKWNWYTGTLIHIYFEREWEGYQFQITLFGLGFFVRVNTEKSLAIFKKLDDEARAEFPELYEKN